MIIINKLFIQYLYSIYSTYLSIIIISIILVKYPIRKSPHEPPITPYNIKIFNPS